MCRELGIETGVDLEKLVKVGKEYCGKLDRELTYIFEEEL